ncbi:DUF4390 domain-containing protein [Thiohalophilus thiocyanatoxydans]|uniref:Uncharacterized protein DUF4390 n=1 Tax=Thiohalophilus thiocyanatoxydans TaxID=381308 RepID=A0A4R8J0L8_9GAMM|nr:DUF4390 domain-containing protein [Thiohalophilus thiocyanatoxydans]TDY03699.1 uncharacterized protein DUF4390 [Thiohalophilus thiocyanatoxydans]
MAFITHVWSRQAESATPGPVRWLRYLLLASALGTSNTVFADNGFVIRSAQLSLHGTVYHLDARINYRLSQEAVDAVKNGVPLIIAIDIRVDRKRRWWLDKELATLTQNYLLLYHALTEKYVIHNLNSGIQENYANLDTALWSLGRIDGLPLIDANLLKPGAEYGIELRARLDIESLPAPMRPLAYISSDWQLQSDWYSWSLAR